MYIINKDDLNRISDAQRIQEKFITYGYEMSLAEIIDFWYWVSYEHFCAGWLRIDDELIEQTVEYIENWISERRVNVVEFKY